MHVLVGPDVGHGELRLGAGTSPGCSWLSALSDRASARVSCGTLRPLSAANGSSPSRRSAAAQETSGRRVRDSERLGINPGGSELGDPAGQEAPLRIGARELERALVGHTRVLPAAQAPQQLAPGGVQVLVIIEVELVDDLQRTLG